MPVEDTVRAKPGLSRLTTASRATRQHTRANNLRLVLQVIYRGSPISRADIARTTGLTAATASRLVDDLIGRGLVRALGRGTSSDAGGKPPVLLAPSDGGRNIVSLDLSTRPFQGAVVDLSGAVVRRRRARRPAATGDAAVAEAQALIRSLAAAATAPVIGIGVGTPGVVDPATGATTAANLEWDRLDVAARLGRVTDLPIHVINDAQAAALAEFALLSAVSSLVVVRVGEGIGAGIILDGHLYRGDTAAAGEIGHIRVLDDGPPCRCGNHGCLETVAAIPAILRRALAGSTTTPETLAALADEPTGAAALDEAATHLGTVLAGVAAVLAVRRVVLSGPVVAAGDRFLSTVRGALRDRVLPLEAPLIEVTTSSLGDDAVLAGAAGLVLSEEIGVLW